MRDADDGVVSPGPPPGIECAEKVEGQDGTADGEAVHRHTTVLAAGDHRDALARRSGGPHQGQGPFGYGNATGADRRKRRRGTKEGASHPRPPRRPPRPRLHIEGLHHAVRRLHATGGGLPPGHDPDHPRRRGGLLLPLRLRRDLPSLPPARTHRLQAPPVPAGGYRIRDLSLGLYFVYSALMESSALQGTLGKWLLGIAVVDEAGRPLSFSRSRRRNSAKVLSFLPLGLGCFWTIWSPRRQAWHDKIAHSLVVKRSTRSRQEVVDRPLEVVLAAATPPIGPRNAASSLDFQRRSSFALFPELDKHVVSRPPCASGVSWTLLRDQDPAPQGGRTCSLHPPSARSYSGSAPSSPRRPSPPSSTSPPAGASRTGTATSPS